MLGFHAVSEAPLSALADSELAQQDVSVAQGFAVSVTTNIHGGQGDVAHGFAVSASVSVLNTQNRIDLLRPRHRKGNRPPTRGRARRLDGALWHVPDPVPPPNFTNLRRRKGNNPRRRGRIRTSSPHMIDWARRTAAGRGLYRIFNGAEYRFYRTDGAPPAEGDAPLESNPTLPHTTAATFADGDWYLSVDFFNGVLSSGFLVLGTNGETWVRLPLSGGADAGVPPQAPQDVRLGVEAGGVVRVFALYLEVGSLRADEFAIAFTTDGSPPPVDTPDLTQAIPAGAGLAVLELALPAQADSTLVRVRVQVRRTGTPDVYSEGSSILDATADAVGPSAPLGGEAWPGSLPEGL